jgi:hypothetical protein
MAWFDKIREKVRKALRRNQQEQEARTPLRGRNWSDASFWAYVDRCMQPSYRRRRHRRQRRTYG